MELEPAELEPEEKDDEPERPRVSFGGDAKLIEVFNQLETCSAVIVFTCMELLK